MAGLKIMCLICRDDFVEADEIYSTTCGHIFHRSCMREWQNHATRCPQCRSDNPETHKLYFIPGDTTSAPPTDDVDFKVKLESCVKRIHELQAQVEEGELNFCQLLEQHAVGQKQLKLMKQRIAHTVHIDNESNFGHLHAQYLESKDLLKIVMEENERRLKVYVLKADELAVNGRKLSALKKKLKSNNIENAQYSQSNDQLQLENKRLAAENEHKSKEIVRNTKVILDLLELCNANQIKVNTLEQKNKYIAGNLEMTISNNKRLDADTIKLQSYIKRMGVSVNATKEASILLKRV